jgi:hypothetical protein
VHVGNDTGLHVSRVHLKGAGGGEVQGRGCRDVQCSLHLGVVCERHRVFAVVQESGGLDIFMQSVGRRFEN